ncbi:MAG: hypothetical protein CVU43_01725 [Chloroflexi bacterium HGW-Chloroflexi-5]|jgi:hypothetical protein|nr:MAG: hypothetical protein CVU43_01725 [Chloroflexi bacterium HGW-Chloroflexi-5]
MNRLFNSSEIIEYFSPFQPPKEFIGDKAKRLSSLIRNTLVGEQIPDLLIDLAIQSLLGLIIVHDNIIGIATPINNTEGSSEPLNCLVAKNIVLTQSENIEVIGFIDQYKKAILDSKIRQQFPEIFIIPSSKLDQTNRPNSMVSIHYDCSSTVAYKELALDLHEGLLNILPQYNWGSEEKNLDAYKAIRTGLKRVFSQIVSREAIQLKNLINLSDKVAAEDLVMSICEKIPKIQNSEELIGRGTQNAYSWAFITTLIIKGKINRNLNDRKNRLSERGAQQIEFDAEPPDETPIEIKERLVKIEKEERRAKSRGSCFDEIEKDFGATDSRNYISSDEMAVMENYIDWLSWNNCLHPNEVVEFLRIILFSQKNNKEKEMLVPLFLSMLFMGRTSKWLCEVRVGKKPDDSSNEKLEYPIYDKNQNAIYYSPVTFEDIPMFPKYRNEQYVKVSPYWCLPIPNQLIDYWVEVSKECSIGSPVFDFKNGRVKSVLKGITERINEKYPAMPLITETRIRGSFTAMMILICHLDPALVAVISDQRTLVPHATLFYNTIPLSFLDKKYQESIDSICKYLNNTYPDISFLPSIYSKIVKTELVMGSGYFPKVEELKDCIRILAIAKQNEKDFFQKHNLKTILLLYCMSLLCGLRISEVCDLRTDQFDKYSVKANRAIKLLIIPEAKSSKYATASRLIPIPEILHKLMDDLLSLSINQTMAFFIYDKYGKKKPITAKAIDDILLSLEDAHFPRFHSGRHLLHTYLVLHNMLFEATNSIFGHTREGEELFNPYIPGDIISFWEEYLFHANNLAIELGLKEVL